MEAAGDALRKHFLAPRNTGEVESPDGRGRGTNPACGDVLELTLRVADGRVIEARFRARACSAVIATASLVTEALRGLTLEEAAALDPARLVEAAGGLPPGRTHAPAILARAIAEALGGGG